MRIARAARTLAALGCAAALAAAPDGPEARAGGFSFDSHWASTGLAALDLDGDGTLDLAASQLFKSTTVHRGRIEIRFGDPALTARVAERILLSTGADPRDLVAADLDGNGLADLATADAFDGTVTVHSQMPGRVFQSATFPATERPQKIASGDLNQDGLPDLAVAGARDVVVLFQDGLLPGAFLPPSVAAADAGAKSLVVADADGAGGLDIVVGLRRDIGLVLQDPGTPGVFLPILPVPVRGRGITGIAAADLDGDGRVDFPWASPGTYPDLVGAGVGVLFHVPGGGALEFADETISRDSPQRNVTVRDMDNDGTLDLVSGGRIGVAWYRQDPLAPGDFKRLATRAFTAAEGPLAVADLDLDGFADPVASFFDSFYAPRKPAKPNKFLKPRRFRSP